MHLERSLTLRGRRFGLIEWPGRGPQLLFLHGWMDQAGVWRRVAEQLPGHRMALDLRGFGRSEHNPEGCAYAFAEYLGDLDTWIKTLSGPIVLIGHSMGGTLASMYAGLRPERIAALVLVDGLGLADGLSDTVSRLRQHLDGLVPARPARVFGSLQEAAARLMAVQPGLDSEHAYWMAERGCQEVLGGWQWRSDPRHRGRLAVPYRQDQHIQVLREICCPSLTVHPERASFAASDVHRLESAISQLKQLQIPGTGHAIHLDAPLLLAAAIKDFLTQNHLLDS